MDLQEQLYKNTNRKYYHGANEDKTIYGKFIKPTCFYRANHEIPMTWLTTNVLYAMDYVGKIKGEYIPQGRIYILHLVETTNIFNIQSDYDRRWIIKEMFHRESGLKEKEIISLFYEDWTNIDSIDRSTLQKIIKSGEYEGLFNYEAGDTYAPSVGLFNAQKAEIIETVSSSEFMTKFAKQIENGQKRAKIVLEENFEISKTNARKAKVPLRMLREQMDKIYGELFDDEEIWES